MLVLCKFMFNIIAAIQINEKYCDIYFDRALSDLVRLVCCDQGSIDQVCCYGSNNNNSSFSLVSVSH